MEYCILIMARGVWSKGKTISGALENLPKKLKNGQEYHVWICPSDSFINESGALVYPAETFKPFRIDKLKKGKNKL